MELVVKSLVIERPGLGGSGGRFWGCRKGPSWIRRKSGACSKELERTGLGGAPEADFGAAGRGPPGFGGKVEPVVKSLVIEWPGLDGGLRIPIFSLPEGALPDPEAKWSL